MLRYTNGEKNRFCRFHFTIFEKKKGFGDPERIDQYPYVKHIINLLSGNCDEHLGMMNEEVGDKNKI